MKRTILIYSMCFFTLSVFSQKNPNGIPNYNSILGIEAHNLIEDFSLIIDMSSGNINYPKEVTKSLLSARISVNQDDFFVLRSEVYRFNEEQLIEDDYLSYGFSGKGEVQFSTSRKYAYNDKGRLLSFEFYDKGVPVGEKTVYSYFDDGNINSKTEIVKGRDNKVTTFKQLPDGYLEYETEKYKTKYLIVSAFGKKVRQIIAFNKTNNTESESWYGYEEDINSAIQKVTLKNAKQEIIYKYTTGKRLTQVSTTDLKENTTKHHLFYYVDDQYGNWILKKEAYKGEGLSIHEQASSEVNIRQIKYENGEVTGFLKPEGEAFKKALKEVNTQIFFDRDRDFNVPQSGAFWKKNEDGSSYWFYVDGIGIAESCKSFFGHNDLYVFNPKTRVVYKLKSFKTRLANTYYEAEKIAEIGYTSGLWIKYPNQNFKAFNVKGDQIQITDKRWAKNNKDFVVFGDREKGEQYLLKDYNNSKANIIYEAKMYHQKADLANVEAASHSSSKSLTDKLDALTKEALGDCVKGDCNNGFGKRKWHDGRVFEGFFENGKAQGPGTFTDKDGSQIFTTYNGSFKSKIGFTYNYVAKSGTTEFLDLQKNLAFISESKPETKLYSVNLKARTRTWQQPNANSNCLVGNCQNGVGVYRYNNGAIYLGTFNNGTRHGFGELTFTDGQFYVGEFFNGKKQGLGCYVWTKNKYFSGEWHNDQFHGKGIMMYDEASYNYKAGKWQRGSFTNSLDRDDTITNNASSVTASSNIEIDEETFSMIKNYVDNSKGDYKYLAIALDNEYRKLKKTLSGEALYREAAKYFIALHKIDPKLPFTMFMKWKESSSLGPIRELLPKDIQQNIRNQAQGVMDGYQKHMNSKETKDAIKKHGGSIERVNNN